tara:strand:- start:1424 stop:2440 length:1017 start_codon:yes stop_codon:yes gene_type:complete
MKYPFIIAEISANHNGSLDHAKKLIKLAKEQGMSAVKIQTYTADTMTIKTKSKKFIISSGIWKGESLWNLYDKGHTPWDWHKKLFDYAKKLKIKIFSTPFDVSAVNFLEKLNCPLYKVSSFEMNDLGLIKRIAKTKKTMIISTGLSKLNEIKKTVLCARKYGAKKIILLYCVSNYPSKSTDFNLNNMNILKKKFNCDVGLSDHSLDNNIAIGAAALGAKVFEKHIALKNQKKGLDIKFSLKGKEIGKYKDDIFNSYNLVAKNYFFRSKDEIKNRYFRRSIFSIKDIMKGEKFSENNIKTFRPNIGLSASFFNDIIGKKSPKNIKAKKPIGKNILGLIK